MDSSPYTQSKQMYAHLRRLRHIERLSDIAHDYYMTGDDKDSAVPVILAAIMALLVCFALVMSYEAIYSAPESDITSSN